MKKIAVIGSGISGISASYYLNKLNYDVSIYESNKYFGGHTNTHEIEINGIKSPVDTGFLVHNDRTYPNLIDFFSELNIETFPSEMSFSVMRKSDGITWAGSNLLTIFAQYKNLFSLRFHKFLREVLRFNKLSLVYLSECEGNLELTLEDLLLGKKYSEDFKKWYLLPMGGCIWSCPKNELLNFPAFTFLKFCLNHGLLQIFNRPKWKTVLNGCNTYVEKVLKGIEKKYLNEPVLEIKPHDGKLNVKTNQRSENYDYCIICTHPPEALKMLEICDPQTKELLYKFKFQENKAVLHLDESVLPDKKIAWSAWNYTSTKSDDGKEKVSVSYLINKLQPLPYKESVIVTLNPVTKINNDKIIKIITYQHPLFSTESIKAQEKMNNIQGSNGIYFSGAWMRYGFHEDGIFSTKKAIKKLLSDDSLNNNLINIL